MIREQDVVVFQGCGDERSALGPSISHPVKTKICRELVKALYSYIGDCREQLGRYEGKDSSASALHGDIEWLFNEAEADLAYYRQIKSDIAEVGIEEALRHSSRKVTHDIRSSAADLTQCQQLFLRPHIRLI